MAITPQQLNQFKDDLLEGFKKVFTDETKKVFDASGKKEMSIEKDGRKAYFDALFNQNKQDKLDEIQRMIDSIDGRTKLGAKKIEELENEKERLNNGGISKKDEKDFRNKQRKETMGNAQAAIKGIMQIAQGIAQIVFTFRRNELAIAKNYYENNSKLLKAELAIREKQMATFNSTVSAFGSLATDMAYATYQASSTEAMGYYEQKVSQRTASQEFQAAEIKRSAKTFQSVADGITTGLLGAAAVMAVIPGIGWAASSAITAAVGGLVKVVSSIWSESEEIEAERIEQIKEAYKDISDITSKSVEQVANLVKELDDYTMKIVNYTKQNENVYKNTGMVTGFTGDRYSSYSRAISAGLSKTFDITAQQAQNMMKSYASESSRMQMFGVQDYNSMHATGEAFGINEGEAAKLFGQMNVFNTSIQSGTDMLTKEWKVITKMGLSSTKFAKDLEKNLKAAESHNFKGGVQNMMKLTRWAQQTRFNLDSAVSFSEKIMGGSLSDALETSAKLQVLGGSAAMYSDPLGMLYDAGADIGNLAKRQAAMFSDLTGRFNEATGETEFSWYENRMIQQRAQAAGLDVGDVKNQIRQKQKQARIDRELANYGLDEETKVAIGNRATFDEKTKSWMVETTQGKMTAQQVASLTDAERQEILLPENEEQSLVEIAANTRSMEKMMQAQTHYLLGTQEKKLYGNAKGFVKDSMTAEKRLFTSGEFATQAASSMKSMGELLIQKNDRFVNFLGTSAGSISDYRKFMMVQVDQTMKLTDTAIATIRLWATKGQEATEKLAVKYAEYINNNDKDSLERLYKSSGNDERLYLRAISNGQFGTDGKFRLQHNDGAGNTNGGYIAGASNVKSINDGAVMVKTAKTDQYLAAMPNGPIDKILQQLIPGMQALIRNGNSNSNGGIDINFNGKIIVSEDGSSINLVELIKNNPSAATQFVNIITKAMDINKNGKPTVSGNYKV